MYRAFAAITFAVAACLALIACSAHQAPSTSSPAPEAGAAEAAPYAPEVQDISMYVAEIRRWRLEMGLAPDPLESTAAQFTGQPMARPLVCEERADSGKCGDVCELSDHICQNAEDICRIAGDMPGNTWANDKCVKAKASCQEAEKKCCACDEGALGGGGGNQPNNHFWN